MSTENDVARSLRSWLREDRHEDAARVLGTVFDLVPATPQRRTIRLARRFPVMNNNNVIRLGIAAAAVILAVMLGIGLLNPSVGDAPDATASSEASAQPSEADSPLPLAILPDPGPDFDRYAPLPAGTYSLTSFPVGITFQVPAGVHL